MTKSVAVSREGMESFSLCKACTEFFKVFDMLVLLSPYKPLSSQIFAPKHLLHRNSSVAVELDAAVPKLSAIEE